MSVQRPELELFPLCLPQERNLLNVRSKAAAGRSQPPTSEKSTFGHTPASDRTTAPSRAADAPSPAPQTTRTTWEYTRVCPPQPESLTLHLRLFCFCASELKQDLLSLPRWETICVHSAWLPEALHRILQPVQTPRGPHTLQAIQLQPLWEDLQADLHARHAQTHSPQRHRAHRGGAGGLLRTPRRSA